MAFRKAVEAIISNNPLQQLEVNTIEGAEQLRLLFPHLFERHHSKTQRHACVQTMPEVDPEHIPWVLDVEKKANELCVALYNLLNSMSRPYDDYACNGHVPAVGRLDLNSKFSSEHLVDETSDRQNTIKGALKDILELAIEMRNRIPIVDTQPQNFKPEKKPIPRSLIPVVANPVNKRVHDLILRSKPRRSNSMPDLFHAMPQLNRYQSKEKRQNSLEQIGVVVNASGIKSGHYVQQANKRGCPCGAGKENVPRSRKNLYSSESVQETGAIPKRQLPTRTRTASQSTKMKRTTSNKPRWK